MRILKPLRGVGVVAGLTIGLLLSITGAALAATPGWECVPTTAGQAVVSGGTGAAPSCGAGTTAVLAPTFVSSGVGGKPTVQFSGVNLQIINGSGVETTINGEGNLVLGYDEKPGTQTGSHDLLLGGTGNSYTSYGGIVGGAYNNKISSGYASVLGGAENTASGYTSTILGGRSNKTSANLTTVSGGCSNLAGTGALTVNSACTNTALKGYFASILGGTGNQAEGENASVSGGELNTASGFASSIVAGEFNVAEDPFSMIGGGCDDVAGAGTPHTETCGSGGEGINGGASVKYGIKDGTGGLISDVSETSESMNVTDGAGACGNLGIGVANGQVGDTSLFTFPTTGSLPPAALRLTPLGVSTSGFSTFQVCNSSASSITVSDPVKVLTFR